MRRIFKDESRKNWWREENLTNDDLKLGCLQRIADATEKSCLDREKLELDYKFMRERRDALLDENLAQAKRIAALKGVITKLKKRESK